jgi:predicted Zn-dependent protease
LDPALVDFGAALELNPKNNIAHHELGVTLANNGDFAGALAALNEVVKLDPQSAASRYMRGNVLATQGKMRRLFRTTTSRLRSEPTRTQHLRRKAPWTARLPIAFKPTTLSPAPDSLSLTGNFRDAVAGL